MQILTNERFEELCRMFDQLEVPADHPNPFGFAREELRKTGVSDKELRDIVFDVDESGRLGIHEIGNAPIFDDVVSSARRTLRPWRRILEIITTISAKMIEADGGLEPFMSCMNDMVRRYAVLDNLGALCDGIVDKMGLQRVVKPEQAVLCFMSRNPAHNELHRVWEDRSSERQQRRLQDLLEAHAALLVVYVLKRNVLHNQVRLYAA